MTGIVRSYNDRRGYGYIQPLIGRPDTTPDVFFHISSVRGGIAPPKGAEVRFLLVRGERGPQAADIELMTLTAKALSPAPA